MIKRAGSPSDGLLVDRCGALHQIDALLQAIGDCARFRVDRSGRVQSWNRQLQKLCGYRAGEVLGRDVARLGFTPNDGRISRRKILRFASANGQFEVHGRCVRRGGHIVQVRLIYMPACSDNGPAGFDVLVQDVTRRSQAEQDRTLLATIVEDSDDAIFVTSLDGRIQTWNRAAQRLFGYSADEAIGKKITTLLIPPHLRHEERELLSRVRAGKRVDHYESNRIRKDGRRIDVSISLSPIRDSAGRVIAASKIVRDIGERKIAESKLHDREQRMRAIVETAVDAIITIDERGTIESVNPATERLFGYRESQLIGRNVKMLMPEPYQGEHDQYLRNYIRTGKAKIIGIGREVVAMRKDGTTFPINLAVSTESAAKKPLFTGIVHDLSARRRLEQQIVEASTNEQRRIAQDLHDGLCQDLIGIALGADMIARRLGPHGSAQIDPVQRLAASVRDVADQARRLSHGLNPVDLGAGGLSGALAVLAHRITHSFGVVCKLRWDGLAQVHSDTTATQLYRIAQEAISNAIRHGKPTKVEIRLSAAGDRLTMCITDDGIGFSPAQVRTLAPHTADEVAAGSGAGIGLATMHYRSNMIGGILDIRPGRKRGTVVSVSVRIAMKAQGRSPQKEDISGKPQKS